MPKLVSGCDHRAKSPHVLSQTSRHSYIHTVDQVLIKSCCTCMCEVPRFLSLSLSLSRSIPLSLSLFLSLSQLVYNEMIHYYKSFDAPIFVKGCVLSSVFSRLIYKTPLKFLTFAKDFPSRIFFFPSNQSN